MAPKMTIYVPDDLAEQVRSAHEFNASQVAQDAFRSALRKRETTDTVARLRETLDTQEARDQARWRELGSEWARDWATVRELESLAVTAAQRPEYFEPVPHHTLRAFLAERGPEGVGLGKRWKRLAVAGFFEAFAAGALEVWDSVRDEVYGGGEDA